MLSLGSCSAQVQVGELISAGMLVIRRELLGGRLQQEQERADGLKGEVAIREAAISAGVGLVAAGVVRERAAISAGAVVQERSCGVDCSRNKRQNMALQGLFIPSVTAQRSTGNERLRASNQEASWASRDSGYTKWVLLYCSY